MFRMLSPPLRALDVEFRKSIAILNCRQIRPSAPRVPVGVCYKIENENRIEDPLSRDIEHEK
ncbi:hypothetical protein EJB05_35176, partial [Eragrostis curvula]